MFDKNLCHLTLFYHSAKAGFPPIFLFTEMRTKASQEETALGAPEDGTVTETGIGSIERFAKAASYVFCQYHNALSLSSVVCH